MPEQIKFIDRGVISECPECGCDKFWTIHSIRSSNKRVNGKGGLQCKKCLVILISNLF